MSAGRGPRRSKDGDRRSTDGDGPWLGIALRSRWALGSLAALLYWAASHSLRPLVGVRLDELGASDAQIGMVIAVWPALSLLLAVPLGLVLDRTGVRPFLVAGTLGMAVAGLGYSVASGVPSIALLQMLSGTSELGCWISLQALMSHAGGDDDVRRRAHLGLFSLTWAIGIAIGPILGASMYELGGFRFVALAHAAAALLCLVAVSSITARAPERADPEAAPAGARQNLRRAVTIATRPAMRGVILSSFMSIYVTTTKLSFYVVYLTRDGYSVARVGILLTVMNVAQIAIRAPLPTLARIIGPGRLLIVGMWGAIVGLALTPVLPDFWSLAVAAVAIGAGYGMNPPLTVEIISKVTRPDERGAAMGLRVSANRSAQIVQPLVFGGLAGAVGMALAFPISSAILGAVALYSWRSMKSFADV